MQSFLQKTPSRQRAVDKKARADTLSNPAPTKTRARHRPPPRVVEKSDMTPHAICNTAKHQQNLQNVRYVWASTKLLEDHVTRILKIYPGINRKFQSFRCPIQGKPLQVVPKEKEFGCYHWLCGWRHNQLKDDGIPCEHHYLYEGITLGRDAW